MESLFKVSKEIEFDYGHRVPFHKSKCFNTHGHRGKIIATLEGKLVDISGDNDFGMVMDFGKIKEALVTLIHDKFDHKFILWAQDPLYDSYINLPGAITVDFVPTAENIARHCFDELKIGFHKIGFQGRLTKVVFYETPTSYAEVGDKE